VAPRRRSKARRLASRLAAVDATRAAIFAVGLLGLAFALYQLAEPGALYGVTEYDDGPYFGSSVLLVHGYLPYRDFAFSMPPGITLLMAPVAAVARLVGTRMGIAIARLVTALVAGVNCSLAGAMVRHRGASAVLVAGGLLALWPNAVFGDHTLLLEPYLSAFCLLSLLLAFTGTAEPTRRRILVAGCALGFAGDIKVWAIFVAIPALVVMAITARQRVRAYLAGIVLGFAVPALPFFLAAPTAMVRDNVVMWFVPDHIYMGTLMIRLSVLTGVYELAHFATDAPLTTVVVAAAMALLAVGYVVRRRWTAPVEWLVLGSAATTATALLAAPLFYPHHLYFAFVFIAPALAVALTNAVTRAAAGLARQRHWPAATIRGVVSGAVVGALVLVGAVLVVPSDMTSDSALLKVADTGAVIAATIPAGSCVVSDRSIVLLVANRFLSDVPDCPRMVDPQEVEAVVDGRVRYSAPANDRVVADWIRWFSVARYAILSNRSSRRIPWNRQLREWFHAHYRPLHRASIWERLST
jgi:hypothetical protein